jgi:hypothetical protein
MFTTADLEQVSALVAAAWTAGTDRDWRTKAGTLEWTCRETADHAVDTVLAPAFFLASRKTDGYPALGETPITAGPDATVEDLVEGLATATRILVAVIDAAEPSVRAVLFSRPLTVAPPEDFAPRGGLELILHAHDVCAGLGVPFEPPADLCHRLREHTRTWPMWTRADTPLGSSDDPWGDLLTASGRQRRPAST